MRAEPCDSNCTVSSAHVTSAGVALEATFRRIDVNDMKVTRPNGSVYFAKGTYTVTATDSNNTEETVVEDAPTKTGIDVAAGLIDSIEVSALTESGAFETQRTELNFTHRASNVQVARMTRTDGLFSKKSAIASAHVAGRPSIDERT